MRVPHARAVLTIAVTLWSAPVLPQAIPLQPPPTWNQSAVFEGLLNAQALTIPLRHANFALENASSDTDKKGQTLQVMRDALAHMSQGTQTLGAWESSITIFETLHLSTDVLAKQDIRGSLQKVRDWGTTLGSVAAAVALISNSGKDHSKAAGAGIGIVAASQLVGSFFGKKMTNKIAAEAVFISMSVTAYDNLKKERDKMDSAAKDNQVLVSEIGSIATVVNDSKKTQEEQLAQLKPTIAMLDRYQAAIQRLLTIMDDVQALASQSILAVTVPNDVDDTQLKEVRDQLTQVANGAAEWKKKNAAPVFDFFNVSAETRAALTAAQTAIQ